MSDASKLRVFYRIDKVATRPLKRRANENGGSEEPPLSSTNGLIFGRVYCVT
jgi:hypothetical protein